MSSVDLRSIAHYGPITAIKFFKNFVLAATGPILHVYDLDTDKLVLKRQLFQKNKIHHISFYNDIIVVAGARSFQLFAFQDFLDNKELKERAINEWISSIEILNSQELLILNSHNMVYRVSYSSLDFQIVEKIHCDEKSILYSGSIKILKDRVIIAAGTVMGGVLLWDLDTRQIIHNLIGHEGSIFGVKLNKTGDKIVSCSDDRSIRIWDFQSGENIATGWGHGSRIWCLEFFNDSNHVFSCSEDCTSRIWELTGSELKQAEVWDCHLGKHIWSGDVSDKYNLSATGGADGRLLLHDIEPFTKNIDPTDRYTIESIVEQTGASFVKNEIMKNFCHIKSGLVVLTSKGKVLLLREDKWTLLFEDLKYDNFGLVNGFKEEEVVILTARNGDLLLLRFSEGTIIQRTEIEETDLNASKITNILTYKTAEGKYYLLTDSPNPKAPYVLKELNIETLNVEKSFTLIKPQQTFTTTCITIDSVNNLLFIGSRFVSFVVYELNEEKEIPVKSIYKKLAKGDTITNIRIITSEKGSVKGLVTVRDGVYFIFELNNKDELKILHKNKISKGFLEGGFISNKELYFYGFKSSCFYIWNETKQIELMTELCGGSHRSWDFIFEGSNYLFTYIKNSDLHVREFKSILPNEGMILGGTHGREIRDVGISPVTLDSSKSTRLIMTASEDATVRLSSIHVDGSLHNHWSLREHVSGMQRVKFINNKFACSTAAREEFIIWEINDLTEELGFPLINDYASLMPSAANPDLRIMDFDAIEVYKEEKLIGFVFTTIYSNSSIKIWNFDIEERKFTLLLDDHYTTCCLLNVNFTIVESKVYVLVGATDGNIALWDITSTLDSFDVHSKSLTLRKPVEETALKLDKLIIKQQLHQSGVKALSLTSFPTYLEIVTGGDDNALIVSHINVSDMSLELKSFVERAASSTITSISSISDNRFLVTSVDQIIRVWEINEETELVLKAEKYTTVADTGCSDAWKTEDGVDMLVVGGAGLSFWSC